MDKDKARNDIADLVEKYNKVVEENRVRTFNEETTKKDFILPLFRALGWKVEDSKEVTAEETISKRRVDYGFRIDGISKFFLEAKSLKADLDNEKYFEQAISYAWHKGCTWAVLTDFEEIKVLNAEVKAPNYLQSRFMSIKCNDFLDRFDELLLLSKESFEQGLLDKRAEKWGKRSKKASIDEQLLEDFTRYRRLLTKSITKLNQKRKLTEEQLDEAVQRILDRLIFIRNCEDRELEQKLLISKLREWESRGRGKLIKGLREVFDYFDEHYNSKIFSKRLCDTLDIENEVLTEIIKGLYYTKEKYFTISYDFSVIDADVLGNIYEQYLSHILKKTAKRAKITKKKAHRKEQGIYYTPIYIVDFIVRNTLGKKLENKKTNVEEVRVLDPACGSGSFLIKAFDVFDEYYKKNTDYAQTQLDKQAFEIPFTKKSKILQENIFGVDLDKQAVEIAQLNLLLKIAEKGHRLPLLEESIRRGNSIIDDKDVVGNKAFRWEDEFDDIMNEGGFDVIIGNPPYGAELTKEERDYIKDRYEFSKSNKNTALIFIEKSLELLAKDGYFGMIVPKSLAFSQRWKTGRELIKSDLVSVVDTSKAFEDVLLEQMIIILKKGDKSKKYVLHDISSGDSISIDKKFIDLTDTIILHGDKDDFKIFKKMNQSSKYLSSITTTQRGLPYQKFLTDKKTKYPIVKGRNISRFNFSLSNEYLPSDEVDVNNNKVQSLRQPKIISQRIVAHVTRPRDHIIIMSAIDKEGILTVDTVENTVITDNAYSLEFLLCLFNSKLISWYAYRYIFSKAIRTMDFDNNYVGKIPLPKNKIKSAPFIKVVNRLLALQEESDKIGNKLTDRKAEIEKELDELDLEIDQLIYKVYGITEKEQRIIEGNDV
jgi:type I restriction-modification system DNA methylase subunit